MSWQDKVVASINQNLNDPDGFAEAKVSVKRGESILEVRIGDQTLLFGPVGQDYGTGIAENPAWIIKGRKGKTGGEDESEPESELD